MGKMILIKNCINEVLFYLYFLITLLNRKTALHKKIKNKKITKSQIKIRFYPTHK